MKVDTKAQVPLTGNKMGKTEGSRAPGGSPKDRIGLKASNVAVQTDKKDLWDLIARLKRTLVSQTGSQSPGRESIETKLIPFLSLLESAERVPGNSDLKLAEKFLSLWMEKHRGLLPPRIKKSLSELESLLRSQNVRDNHLYVLTGQDEGAEGKKWRLRVDPEHCRNGREEDDENCEQWRFDFFPIILGLSESFWRSVQVYGPVHSPALRRS